MLPVGGVKRKCASSHVLPYYARSPVRL